MRSARLALVLFAALVGAATLLALLPTAQRWSGDVRLFEEHVGLVLAGRLSETPFLSWYPPLALIPLGLPLLIGSGPIYALALAAEMSAVAATGVPLISRLTRAGESRWPATLTYGCLLLATTALVVWRYDIVPAVLVLFALWAAHTGRWALAGACLALAGGMKVYAVILAPLLLAHAWRAGGRMAAVRVTAAGIGTTLLSLGAYLLFSGSSPTDLLAFTANRPLHLETVAGTLIGIFVASGLLESGVAFGSGSFNLTGQVGWDAVAVLRIIQPAVLVASLGAGAVAIAGSTRPARGPQRALALAWLTAILGLLITNPVLSPQYLLWVLPLLPIVSRNVRMPMIAAIGLTAVVFPWLYSDLIALDLPPLIILAVRNALLVGAWLAAVSALLAMRQAQRDVAFGAAASEPIGVPLRPRVAKPTPTTSSPTANNSVGP